jgi:aromatic ring-opening dioxygenase catalytic subunit (LigB family)
MEWTAGPPDLWDSMAAHLRGLSALLPETPKALLVISAHWEEDVPTVMTGAKPALYFDYSGFPPHTYQLTWPAPGAPELAQRVQVLLGAAGIESGADAKRGFDHGVFIPLKLAFPDAQFPTMQLSLREGLDAAEHLAIGRALAPLRDEGVLIIGSGMSYHNMRGFFRPGGEADSQRFDAWLTSAVESPPLERDARLSAWERAPSAAQVHPRSEHLTPLFVVAGAANGDPGHRAFTDSLNGLAVSGFAFGDTAR